MTENENKYRRNARLKQGAGYGNITIVEKELPGRARPDRKGRDARGRVRGCLAVYVAIRRDNMERQAVIRDLSAEIETLARLHIQHGLHHTAGFAKQKTNIEKLIQDHEVNLRKELDPLVLNLYRRYFG